MFRPGRSRRLAGALAGALALVLAACSQDVSPPDPTPAPASTTDADHITFGVYGSEDELAAYKSVVEVFNSFSEHTDVEMHAYANHDALVQDMEPGRLPDVFLASRRDLAILRDGQLIAPVDQPLVERGIDFGDQYSRDALLAFSADSHLECMPYGISPMVMYYNTRLINLAKMARRGFRVPADPLSWSFDLFAAAAEFATRKGHAKGVYIDPTIRGLAPFIYSGGGQVFDNPIAPTSLDFSDDNTRAALERTLEVLRNPHLTLTDQQLGKHSPLQWFERGKLGMIAGFRDLTPELRQVPGLDWDVIAMPSLGSSRTIGDVTGLCISADSVDPSAAADFLVHMSSSPSVRRVVRTGYLVPANQEVALSEDFLQPHQNPHHPEVFNNSVRSIVDPPLIDSYAQLEAAVADTIHRMFTVPVIGDLALLTQQIDQESQAILAPPSESPSPSDGASPSETFSETYSESAGPSG